MDECNECPHALDADEAVYTNTRNFLLHKEVQNLSLLLYRNNIILLIFIDVAMYMQP
jgi:hypothetical protein